MGPAMMFPLFGSSPLLSRNRNGIRSSNCVRIMQFVLAVVHFTSVVRGPYSNIICNAWIMTSFPTSIHQLTTTRNTSNAKSAKRLWNTKDDNNNQMKEKNYSPFQASWKTTTVSDDTILDEPPKKVTIPHNFPKFEAPKMNMAMMPDLSKFEAPKMGIDMPKMPEMQIQMPSIPEFTIPKLEVPKVPKFPERSQQKTKLPGDTNTGNNDNGNTAKPNYSRHQASWKTTSTTNPTTTTTVTAITTTTAPNGSISFSNLALPTIALPDLSSLGLSNSIHVKECSDEARKLSLRIDMSIKDKVNAFTGRSQYEVGDITKSIIAKVANEEYELAEITFFFRILIAVGADLSGFSAVLPVSGLVGVFGWSISMGLAERFTQFVSIEINKRVNNNLDDLRDAAHKPDTAGTSSSSSTQPTIVIDVNATSAQQYNPGDLTKSALMEYTGKSSYAVGDLAGKGDSNGGDNVGMNSSVLQELEECLSMEKALIEKLGRIQQRQE